jgi:hypothetical protein
LDRDVWDEDGEISQEHFFELNDFLIQQGHPPAALEEYTPTQYFGYLKVALKREQKKLRALEEARRNARKGSKT